MVDQRNQNELVWKEEAIPASRKSVSVAIEDCLCVCVMINQQWMQYNVTSHCIPSKFNSNRHMGLTCTHSEYHSMTSLPPSPLPFPPLPALQSRVAVWTLPESPRPVCLALRRCWRARRRERSTRWLGRAWRPPSERGSPTGSTRHPPSGIHLRLARQVKRYIYSSCFLGGAER